MRNEGANGRSADCSADAVVLPLTGGVCCRTEVEDIRAIGLVLLLAEVLTKREKVGLTTWIKSGAQTFGLSESTHPGRSGIASCPSCNSQLSKFFDVAICTWISLLSKVLCDPNAYHVSPTWRIVGSGKSVVVCGPDSDRLIGDADVRFKSNIAASKGEVMIEIIFEYKRRIAEQCQS